MPDDTEPDLLDAKRGADMIYAARQGDEKEVQRLLNEGVPVSFRGNGGWTALRWAAAEGHEGVLSLLLEQGAMEDEVEASADDLGGGSSLHWAAYKGHVRSVWRLLTCKPPLSPKALDSEHNTPLHLASASGHLLILKTLLSQGVDVSLTNAYGNTASSVSTSPDCQSLLKQAAAAALDGRPYLCSCSGEFCSEANSSAASVIDAVSHDIVRPVRYSEGSHAEIRASEDGLQAAMPGDSSNAELVEPLDAAITRAQKIGASLPIINEGVAGLERLRAQIALSTAVNEIQGARPLQDRALLRPLAAPLKQAAATGVSRSVIADAENLQQTVEAEISLFDMIAASKPHKMTAEAEVEEPPSAESDFAKRAEAAITKLAGAIHNAQNVDAMLEVMELGETELSHLSAESELRKALLAPKEGQAEDGTPCWTQHNGSKTYSALEDLQFRNDFLDAALEKCIAAETAPGIIAHAQKVQKELKVRLKEAQIEDEERKAKEAAAAAKAAKKGKKKK